MAMNLKVMTNLYRHFTYVIYIIIVVDAISCNALIYFIFLKSSSLFLPNDLRHVNIYLHNYSVKVRI